MTLAPFAMQFDGHHVAGVTGGHGRPLLLLHGSGPGASLQGNWRRVLEPLAQRFHVLAIDLIGFGASDRRRVAPYFDFDFWCRQALAALDAWQVPQAAILGHSLSGAIALRLAAEQPARITHVITTGTMGTTLPLNDHLPLVWRCPRSVEDMRRTAAALIYDRALITEEYLAQRMRIIGSDEYRRYFDTMFGGDLRAYLRATTLSADQLGAVQAPVLMIHGRQDLAFPAEQTTLVLAPRLSNCDIVLLDRCSHSVALEHSDKLVGLCALHYS